MKFDFRDFERVARNLGAFADQIPFALAQTLNDAIEATRKDLAESTWPKHVQARNKSFLKAALSTKGSRATKKNLKVVLYDRLGRASLALHAKGGSKLPRGKAIAIPSRVLAARRTGKGVPKGLRPRALPNSFVKGDSLYQRTGKQGQHLKLMYTLAPTAKVAADVPFDTDFEHDMRREVRRAFPKRIQAAMQSRRKRQALA